MESHDFSPGAGRDAVSASQSPFTDAHIPYGEGATGAETEPLPTRLDFDASPVKKKEGIPTGVPPPPYGIHPSNMGGFDVEDEDLLGTPNLLLVRVVAAEGLDSFGRKSVETHIDHGNHDNEDQLEQGTSVGIGGDGGG
eukprot:CAMPEP_0119511350 /NCGR_PEP_ID=MMETSP1344-20130328/30030_1 /TAXON_ID=236787 /ORGANISM="Florenciella parvula, Strain CCMP2471" /LENGTH=138 /DNA_ID=CAMNT_0007548347 /DNA_START=169 /DNA_END=581 /DNA_ORIENTATION=+